MTAQDRKNMLATLILGAFVAAGCGSDSSSDGIDGGDIDDGGQPGADSGPPPAADATATGPLAGWCTNQPSNFSFFVTSMPAIWALAGDPISDLDGGMGGDFGGLAGADQLCQGIASATGHGNRTWRAFLSATNNGDPINAIERIGTGPWHDANGRLVANNVAGLLSGDRPDGDAQTIDDLPDECGVPITLLGDAHDVVTGSNKQGMLNNTDPESTCNDWTSSDGNVGGDGTFFGGLVMCGHSFPRNVGGGGGGRGLSWLSDHQLRGCGKGANLLQNGAGEGTCIGCTGGYGAIYCFAL